MVPQILISCLGGLVQTIPQVIEIESPDIGDFVSQKNDIVYFNPAESIGVANTVGKSVSVGKSFTLGEISKVVSILSNQYSYLIIHLVIIKKLF